MNINKRRQNSTEQLREQPAVMQSTLPRPAMATGGETHTSHQVNTMINYLKIENIKK